MPVTSTYRPKLSWNAALLAALLSLAACGGSDGSGDGGTPSDPDKEVPKASVTVIGDSLSDVGVFGVRYTVQSDAAQAPFPLWPELVADGLGAARPCPAYKATSETSFVPQQDCRSYAVAGGRIQHPQLQTPLSIITQLQDAADRVGNNGFGDRAVVLIDGGGNDIADLITAYFGAYLEFFGGNLTIERYRAFLSTVLGRDKTLELTQQPGGWEKAGEAYMQELAVRFSSRVQNHVLMRDGQRVVVLNVPDVTRTPRFQAILALLRQLGGSHGGESVAAELQALFQGWARTFNQTLESEFKGMAPVAIVDFYGLLAQWADHGEQFGLTNTTSAVCPVEDPAATMPSYDIAQCTVAWLDANAPAGTTPAAGWWNSYAFADGFHPTPRGHALMARAVLDAIAAKGWK